jgi:hypothetical protein
MSATPARLADCRAAAGTGPSTLGSDRVAVAAATIVGAYPRLNPPRAVEFTHMWVMNPARTRLLAPSALSRSSRSVCTNEFGYCFTTTGSPSRGATLATMAPLSPSMSYGEPAPPECWMWMTGIPAVRARSSSTAASSSAGCTPSSAITPSV